MARTALIPSAKPSGGSHVSAAESRLNNEREIMSVARAVVSACRAMRDSSVPDLCELGRDIHVARAAVTRC